MKHYWLVLVCIVLLVIPFTYAGALSSPQVTVTLQSQSPDPVEPGQVVTVKFKVENEGAATIDDAIVILKPQFPFSLYGDTAEKNIGKLRAGSTGADAVIVQYKVKVAEAAVEGNAELELDVQLGLSSVRYNNDEFLIDVQTHAPVLEVTSITSDPVQIPPGETAEVTVTVKNSADSLLKDVKLKLDFSSSTLPLAPYHSSSERKITQLHRGYQDSLIFTVITDPSATPGLYKIPLNITYNDEKGNAYAVDDILSLTIGDTPSIKPYIKKSTVLQSNQPGKITVGIANAGTIDVKLLELYLLPSEDYQLISTTDYIYVGDIDSDDTESEEIDIYVTTDKPQVNFPLKLKYVDANNREFQQQFDLQMNIYSSSQLKKFGILETNYAPWYLLLIVLIAGGAYWYKKKRRSSSRTK